MKRFAIFSTLLFICLFTGGTAFGQQGCEFDIIGTWNVSPPAEKNLVLYHFTPDGKVTVLSSSGEGQALEPRVIASASYALDNPQAPKSIAFTAGKGRVFAPGTSSMRITGYDDESFTCVKRGSGPTRWIRVDPNRYFIVLTARSGEFYDGSGSAFPMLIKVVGQETQIAAVGTYSNKGKSAFGPVPTEAYQDFMNEPRGDSEVMLRLEISPTQYERGLKVLRIWERRVREDALLYPAGSPLNNVLLVKAVTETLNQCSEEIKLYKLDYIHPTDWIAEKYAPPFIPFAYFKELRRLNGSLHVKDDKFHQVSPSAGLPLRPQ